MIHVKRLAVDMQIGVYPHEKKIKQRLYVSLQLNVDFTAAMQSDALQDTYDYAKISLTIKETLENSQFELIERVLGEVAFILEHQFEIQHFAIEVAKPTALESAYEVVVSLDRL